jgi:predicted nucleotidyltransferase
LSHKINIKDYQFYQALTRYPCIEAIWLFGSRARQDNQERADIDLAVLCPKARFEDWCQIEDTVDNADTLLKIDLVRLDALPDSSALKISILKEGIKLYEQS